MNSGTNGKGFWLDRTALTFAAAGVGCMVLTLAWRINPVEGSVVPRFLTDNPFGLVLFCLLFATCMPVWVACLIFGGLIFGESDLSWFPKWLDPFWLLVLSFQAILFFLLGKLVSVCRRRLLRKNKPQSPNS